jgi:hypothetical protein
MGRRDQRSRIAAEQIRLAAATPHRGRQDAPSWALQEDHLMQSFIVEAANRPGEMARVADSIAKRGINVEAFCVAYGNKGAAAFLAFDEKGVRSALDSEGFNYHETPVLTIWLEDKPGQLAWAAKQLGDAGVNIELLAPVEYGAGHKATIAIGVDKIDEAQRALSDHLTEWRIPEKVLASTIS